MKATRSEGVIDMSQEINFELLRDNFDQFKSFIHASAGKSNQDQMSAVILKLISQRTYLALVTCLLIICTFGVVYFANVSLY